MIHACKKNIVVIALMIISAAASTFQSCKKSDIFEAQNDTTKLPLINDSLSKVQVFGDEEDPEQIDNLGCTIVTESSVTSLTGQFNFTGPAMAVTITMTPPNGPAISKMVTASLGTNFFSFNGLYTTNGEYKIKVQGQKKTISTSIYCYPVPYSFDNRVQFTDTTIYCEVRTSIPPNAFGVDFFFYWNTPKNIYAQGEMIYFNVRINGELVSASANASSGFCHLSKAYPFGPESPYTFDYYAWASPNPARMNWNHMVTYGLPMPMRHMGNWGTNQYGVQISNKEWYE